jgi:hypothetical protein
VPSNNSSGNDARRITLPDLFCVNQKIVGPNMCMMLGVVSRQGKTNQVSKPCHVSTKKSPAHNSSSLLTKWVAVSKRSTAVCRRFKLFVFLLSFRRRALSSSRRLRFSASVHTAASVVVRLARSRIEEIAWQLFRLSSYRISFPRASSIVEVDCSCNRC